MHTSQRRADGADTIGGGRHHLGAVALDDRRQKIEHMRCVIRHHDAQVLEAGNAKWVDRYGVGGSSGCVR
jgi:hypothetical protein